MVISILINLLHDLYQQQQTLFIYCTKLSQDSASQHQQGPGHKKNLGIRIYTLINYIVNDPPDVK